MKKIIGIIIVIIVVLGGVMLYMHRGMGGERRYVTSERCSACHARHYEGWKKTLHPKMFRPVSGPEDIVADFSILPEELSFKKEDVKFVVGSKWEQVYVKLVDGEYYPMPAKWFITTKKWVPVKHSDETNMSEKCNGCHTTGFDPKSYEFSEFGIGCEACHGPASSHIENRMKADNGVCAFCHDPSDEIKIIKSVSSTVCGQCHNRGTNKISPEGASTVFNFPINYTPDKDLEKYFEPMKKESDKKGKHWWGNGISKNRHQEYGDWKKSKHAKALKRMEKEYTDDRGKKDDRCLKCHSTDYRFAPADKKPTIKTARFGVTCVACHDPHGLDRMVPRLALLKSDGTQRCGGCHADSMSFKSAEKGKAHYPCPPSKVSCADCHMPYIITSGGAFPIRSHAFKIIKPADTIEFGMPNSCQNGSCHGDRSIKWAAAEFDTFYPPKKEGKKGGKAKKISVGAP